MRQGVKIPFEEKRKKVVAICARYSTGEYTLNSCCLEQDIIDKTFYNWCDEYSEFTELYKKAKLKGDGNFDSLVRKHSRDALIRLLKPREIEIETVKEESDGSITTTTVKKIEDAPPSLVIFSLANVDGYTRADKKEEKNKKKKYKRKKNA